MTKITKKTTTTKTINPLKALHEKIKSNTGPVECTVGGGKCMAVFYDKTAPHDDVLVTEQATGSGSLGTYISSCWVNIKQVELPDPIIERTINIECTETRLKEIIKLIEDTYDNVNVS